MFLVRDFGKRTIWIRRRRKPTTEDTNIEKHNGDHTVLGPQLDFWVFDEIQGMEISPKSTIHYKDQHLEPKEMFILRISVHYIIKYLPSQLTANVSLVGSTLFVPVLRREIYRKTT